ncbi:LacI family DNA-binding transcriptional regulator [Kineosporia babensis]|uniref:LacI family DNA-binding transcriptional regulator n=1 Tax=Kineosporia babensis TaxID=499548 RepID=A0A9X1SXH8_9ACTN|nr:LacI family DNA-binding transcriptional regulator [Kineosporia babensis]MCD5315205.1 LacI family DNA-binding transcriptional regulator [Kineosporia babensis]
MPGQTSRPATITDVAARAGVSVPTVSRVLTGAARVSPDKRRLVEAAISELRFRPSAAARVLASRRSQVIAVIAGETSRYGYAETIRGVEEAARAVGYTVMITVVESADQDELDRAMSATLSQPIAGVIVLKFDPPGVAALHRVPADLPVVALSGVREKNIAQAVLDETRAAEELTAFLLGLGHATVHHVRVPPSRREDGRTTGWRRALRKAGAEVITPYDATWEPRSGRAIGHEIAADASVSAVFCGNDEIAMGVVRGLNDQGLRVPEDVSVVGFDNHPLAEMWSPALTTVEQDFAGMGRRGFDLLAQLVNGEDGRTFSSERPRLLVRDSAAAPAPQRG